MAKHTSTKVSAESGSHTLGNLEFPVAPSAQEIANLSIVNNTLERDEEGRIMEEHMIHFRITGGIYPTTESSLNPSDAVLKIQQYPTCWVFACTRGSYQIVQVDQLNEDYLSTVSSISIVPPLCGSAHDELMEGPI